MYRIHLSFLIFRSEKKHSLPISWKLRISYYLWIWPKVWGEHLVKVIDDRLENLEFWWHMLLNDLQDVCPTGQLISIRWINVLVRCQIDLCNDLYPSKIDCGAQNQGISENRKEKIYIDAQNPGYELIHI